MRKIYLFLLALCVSSVTCRMVAQYTVDSSIKDATITTNGDNRYCKGIALLSQKSSVAYGEKQTLSFNEGISSANYTTYKFYNDLTSSGQAFEFKVGQTVNGSFVIYDTKNGAADKPWDGSWMGSYIYLDANNDGVFATDASELLRSSGTAYSGSNIVNSVREFRLPQSVGTYRMRFKIDWPDATATDPSNIDKTGGSITDANITLERPTVTLNYDASRGTVTGGTAADALVCGEAYTFTVAPKSGYDATVTATVGDGTVNVDVTPTNNGDGTYTIPADKFQNDMTINVTFVKHTFTAADALAGNCYFRLKNKSTSGYLKAERTDVSGGKVSANSVLVYNRSLEDSKPAAFIWKLDGGFLTSQGHQVATFGSGNGMPVIEMASSGAQVTIAPYGSYYTVQTTGSTETYKLLHAKNIGMNSGDGNYPKTSNGNYVVTWTRSEDASQWTIEPVEEFDITIGKGGWSTIHYAFPVSLPASVVKAYVVSGETESAVSLTEVAPEGDAILLPSKTPVFLEGTEGAACTVSILLSEPDAISVTNELDGTLVAESPTGEIYGIATPSGTTALYKMREGTTIPCNKAYLKSTQSSVAKLDLNFGGQPTGIESLTPDPTTVDSNVLYDLNGRRVLYPTRGIYVTGSGKKIYLK